LPTTVYRALLIPEQRGFKRMKRLRDDPSAPMTPRVYELGARLLKKLRRRGRTAGVSAAEQAGLDYRRSQTRTTAAWRLEERYPAAFDDLLPTRFGNAMRAAQEYAFSRWGLDTWAVWPRIEALLTDAERDLLTDARTDVAFFLNSALTAALVGGVVMVDGVWHRPLSASWMLYLLPFLIAYGLYRLSVGAFIRWGGYQRAGIDLHRRELFEKLGLHLPAPAREQHALARALNRFILYRPKSPDEQG
jgi:hypothetical protein